MISNKLAMRNKKYSITLGIVLICVMLFTACSDMSEIKDGYGRININLVEAETSYLTKTVLPSIAFDRYVYTFTKEGTAIGVEQTPDDDGFFTLEIGNYVVEVQAYIGSEGSYILVATGLSSRFSVGSGYNDPVEVYLSGSNLEAAGLFNYTITYPLGTVAEITLKKWPDMSDIILNPVDVTQGSGKTQSFQLDAGSYLFTILLSKDGFYAGISEAVHINSSLTTVFLKNFVDDDLIANKIPLSSDYTISGTGTFNYDGNAKTVTVTRNANASLGAITVYYEGTDSTTYPKSTIAPINAGAYTVTFDVEAVTGWSAATGLPAGSITIDNYTPTVGDYTISGAGIFTYNGTARSVSVTPTAGASPGAVTVYYQGASGTTYPMSTSAPIDAGTYTVTFDVAAAPDWNAATGLSAGTITIDRAAGEVVSAPTLVSRTHNSITINTVTAPDNGQTVQYARNTTTVIPTEGWQNGTTFTGLNASTTYYIFARAAENTNYNEGTAARSDAITTRHTYMVTANGSSSSRTTTLTFTFSGTPSGLVTSNITLIGDATIGSATLSSSGTTRTLSPITVTGTTSGTATVTITHPDIETGSKTVTVYNPITAGLYAKAPPIGGGDTPVNLDFTSGTTIVDRAFNYINNNPGTYTLVLGSDINVVAHTSTDISNNTAIRHLRASNAKLTIIGLDVERKISLTSNGIMFAAGRSGQTGIELTIGNNITLVGMSGWATGYTVHVQNGAAFTMRDNATVSGDIGGGIGLGDSGGVYVDVATNSSFTMLDNAKVTGGVVGSITMSSSTSVSGGVFGSNGTIIMSGSASITDGVFGSDRTTTMSGNASIQGSVGMGSATSYNNHITMSGNATIVGHVGEPYFALSHIITMQNNASVFGSVHIGSDSTFNMRDDASIIGWVTAENNSSFAMQNNTRVTNSSGDGVSVSGSGSVFTMSGTASVSNHNRGVSISNGASFTMMDNTSVFNNTTTGNGGGVYVATPGWGSAAATFTMQNNASVSRNTGADGGGVYIEQGTGGGNVYFIMEGNASVSGNTSTGGGGGVYLANGGSFFEMRGGMIFGNNATNSSSNGGGVYVNGAFTMSGGTIFGLDVSTTLRNTAGSGAALYVTSLGDAIRNGVAITPPGSGVDTTIPAGGTPGNITIRYNINGGTGTTPALQTVIAGNSVMLRAGTGFSRTGYNFVGWNTNPAAVGGNSGAATNYNANSSFTPNGNIILYANWEGALTANTWANGNGTQWFRFTANAGTQYIHVSFGTLDDMYVQVYDSSYNTVGANTRLSGSTMQISRPVNNGQVYYVRVMPYWSGDSGTYRIAFNTTTMPPQ